MLDVESELDLYCLHLVYIPIINRSLSQFKEAYNNHPLSTERNMTPAQLWTNDVLRPENSNRTPARQIMDPASLQSYGIDPDSHVTHLQDDNAAVEVPSIELHLSTEQILELSNIARFITPEDESDFRVGKFRTVLQRCHEMF